MPPKRKVATRAGAGKEATDSDCEPPKRKKVAPRAKKNGPYKMPPPLPAGEVLNDIVKQSWVLGDSVGKGGFGEIYRAAPRGKLTTAKDADHVIKIEPRENGPLFAELSFYCRVAKADMVDSWVASHKLSYLAVPKYVSQGMHTHKDLSYRFLVMPCFGEDIEKKFVQAGRQFGIKTVCYLALRVLEALQFLHASEYAHADIKGSNLLTGHPLSRQHEVYLVDYGLAYRFSPEGKHKAYKEDPRRRHDGTLEFTSIDAHKGVTPAPRGDLEILGYCLLQWAAGRLPWEGSLGDKERVAQLKIKYQSDVPGLMKDCFTAGAAPKCLREYMAYVYSLAYEDGPDYARMKKMFHKELGSCGFRDDSKALDWIASGKKRKVVAEEEDGGPPLVKAKLKSSPRVKKKSKSSNPKKAVSRDKAEARKRVQLPSPAHSPPEKVCVHRKESCATTGPPLMPQVSYPAELGYPSTGTQPEAHTSHRSKAAVKKARPTKKRLQKIPTKPSPCRRSPRLVRKRTQRVDLKKVLASDSDEEYSLTSGKRT